MLKVGCIFCFMVLTLTSLLVTARPRNNSRRAGTSKPCASRVHLRDPQGSISSPNFTRPHPANSSCTWIITLPRTTKLFLRITSFNVYSTSKQCGGRKCRCDFLQFKELDPIQNVTGFNEKFCNDFPPKVAFSLMSRVRIRFVFHSLKAEFGFSLNYEATRMSTSTLRRAFDFVPANAGLRSGTSGGAKLPVNQTGQPVNETLTTTISAARNITGTPTPSTASQNSTSSRVDVPLAAFTSRAPVNFQLTSDTSVLPSAEQSWPTTIPRTFAVTGTKRSDKIWTSTVHVVTAVEQREVEEKVPDIIVLGPSVPVVMIFVLVVVGIAWWNYKFNSEELNRYESYAQSNMAKRHKKHLKNISKGNLYNRMTKDWRGQSISVNKGASPMVGKKISFAGKLREGIRTPRPSPAHSEETVPLTKPTTSTPSFLTPDAAPPSGGSRPSSRPASLLLRDALINMLSRTETGETSDSGPPSKRASKRVSFIDEDSGQPLLKQEASLPEKIQEKHDLNPMEDKKEAVEDAPVKLRQLHIPAILVRYPSDEAVNRAAVSPEKPMQPGLKFGESEVFCEDEAPYLEGNLPQNDAEGPGAWNDRDDNYPASTPEEISDRNLIFPDLEDFLLNLDKDSPCDSPPYSCESHVRDILRKSYGEEGLSSLGPTTVLSVPDEFLGMVRGASQSNDRATSDSDHVDDVD